MDLNTTCRTCLHKSSDLIPIHTINFAHGNNSTTMPVLIEFCFKLKVVVNDGLPQNICIKCAETLRCVYDFQVKYYKSAHTIAVQTGNKRVLDNIRYILTDTIKPPHLSTVQNCPRKFPVKYPLPKPNETIDLSSYEHNYSVEAKITTGQNSQTGFISSEPTFYQLVKKPTTFTCFDYNGWATYEKEDMPVDSTGAGATHTSCGRVQRVSRQSQTDITRARIDKKSAELLDCPACDEKGTSPEALEQHIYLSHTRYRDCLICNSKELRYLRAHCRRHVPPKVFCTNCNKGFVGQTHLMLHKKMAVERVLECDTCENRFCLQKDYDWHMKRHELEDTMHSKIFKCCDREFLSEDEFKKHQNKSHMVLDKYTCLKCPAFFENINDYQKHKSTHVVEQLKFPLPCKICNKVLKTYYGMNIHMRKMHDDNEIRLRRCNVCFYVCKTPTAFYRHKNTHMAVKPACCSICSKAFRRNKSLRFHMESCHNNVRRFKCELCNKDYKYFANLATHRRGKTHKKNLKNAAPKES